MENILSQILEKRTTPDGKEYFIFCKEYKEVASRSLSYKGQKFEKSRDGMNFTVNAYYTMDVLASKGDQKMVITDTDCYLRSDYAPAANSTDYVDAGTCFTTESARCRAYQSYDRVVPEMGAIYVVWDEIKPNDKGQIILPEDACIIPEVITPAQLEFYYSQKGRDTSLYQNKRNVSSIAATTFDFAVLATKDGSQVVDHVPGGKFGEEVVSVLKIASPFEVYGDVTREATPKKEWIRWLLFT